MGGASILWAKNNLQLFKTYDEFTQMVSSIQNSGDVFFVPGISCCYP
jgi:glycerol kinase